MWSLESLSKFALKGFTGRQENWLYTELFCRKILDFSTSDIIFL